MTVLFQFLAECKKQVSVIVDTTACSRLLISLSFLALTEIVAFYLNYTGLVRRKVTHLASFGIESVTDIQN